MASVMTRKKNVHEIFKPRPRQDVSTSREGKKEAGLQPAGVQDKEIQYHPLCSSRI